ncbi:hypothetical protein B0T19DRAFT_470677 [Cercophora scortea]|uniref:NmrA-like domain-containing protein n=1 Tax=Cercophora scortea TaxID=314031 RepID=A0AAE0MLG1_9PEZI|nr:hypothetical protein B0T19DRAFT_470677 [Cercophora scortea]
MATTDSTILVLGGTGTVGSRIVSQLTALRQPVLGASRKGTGDQGVGVVFKWQDRATWDNPFKAAAVATTNNDDSGSGGSGSGSIRAVYLIAPPVLDSAGVMMEFVDFARAKGVRRFVLQSASAIESGGPAMGMVHAYLRELGQQGEVDWAVLRPTWFQQNFQQPRHVQTIKEEGKIYSATSDGKIPWVSADDIAAVAVQVLTSPSPHNTEYLVLGPELLSYRDIAETLSEVLGRRIVHVDLTSDDMEKLHQSFGMPEDYSRMMGSLDTAIKQGQENRTNDVVELLTGSAPARFRDFAESNKAIWAQS